MSELESVRKLLKLLLVVVFISLAVISAAVIVSTRNSVDIKKIARSNQRISESNRFLNQITVKNSEQSAIIFANLSDYLSCLTIPDQELFNKLGKEVYIDQCDKLLFEGLEGTPPVREGVRDPGGK